MVPQLEDGENFFAGSCLVFDQCLKVPGVEDQGFFANDVSAAAQTKPGMRVVEVVGAANGNKIGTCQISPLLVDETVKSFELSEECSCGKIFVDDPNAVCGVECCKERIAGLADGRHMAWCDVSGSSDESEGFNKSYCLKIRELITRLRL